MNHIAPALGIPAESVSSKHALNSHQGDVSFTIDHKDHGKDIINNDVAFSVDRAFDMQIDTFDRSEWSLLVDIEGMPTYIDGNSDLSWWSGVALIRLAKGDSSISLQRVEVNIQVTTSTFWADGIMIIEAPWLTLPDNEPYLYNDFTSPVPFASVTFLD